MTARCKLSPVLRTASPEAPGPLSLPSGDRGPRLRRASVVRWTLAGLTFSAALAWLSRHFPSLLFEDDAYFYLQIGWNLGTGAGSTFDGLHQTDGYHLLWAWMLAPLAWGTASLGLGKTTFVAAVSALALAVSGAAVLVTFRAPVERALAMLLFLFGGLTMETTLLAALGLLLLRAHLGEGGATPARVALVAALVPLTRIDYAWLAPSLALLGLGNRRPAHALPLVPTLAGTVAGMAIHFGVEYLIFGAWTSVSSAYRADRMAGDLQPTCSATSRGTATRSAMPWLPGWPRRRCTASSHGSSGRATSLRPGWCCCCRWPSTPCSPSAGTGTSPPRCCSDS